MNILVTSLPDLKRIYPQRPHHLIKGLAKNHNITVLSVNAWWIDENKDEYIEKMFKNVDFHYLSQKKYNTILQEILGGYNLFNGKIRLKDFDIHLNFNSLIFGYLAARKLNIPTIFDICDDLPERIRLSSQIPDLLSNTGFLLGKLMINKLTELSDRITYVNRSLSDFYNIPGDKSFIIPNGVDTSLFKYNPIKNTIFQKEDFVLGFSGLLSEWVDLSTIFQCIKEFDKELRIKMLVVGGGDTLDDHKTLAKKYGLDGEIIFTGPVDYQKVPRYISSMDVCLMGYRITQDTQNSHPMKLFEYMACEKPIIATPLNVINELVDEKVLYAFKKEEMRKSILQLYYDPDLRKEMGNKGRKFVKKSYDWTVISKKFENIMLELD